MNVDYGHEQNQIKKFSGLRSEIVKSTCWLLSRFKLFTFYWQVLSYFSWLKTFESNEACPQLAACRFYCLNFSLSVVFVALKREQRTGF